MIWQDLPIFIQDLFIFLAIVLPILLLGYFISRGYKSFSFIKTLLLKYKNINFLIIIVLGISLAIAVALTSQERAFKTAMAKAASKFDLVITAPGSQIDMMLATVYLKPTDTPLLGAKLLEELSKDKKIDFALPIAYGDSYKSFPVVGSTNTFVKYLSDDKIKGEYFKTYNEAIVGAGVNLKIGDVFSPQHGHSTHDEEEHEIEEHHNHSEHQEHEHKHEEEGHEHNHDEHASHEEDQEQHHFHIHKKVQIKVVGKMPITNSPWDKAIITPIESVWDIHNLPVGHAKDSQNQLGEPFDKEYFPGTPAFLVHAKKLGYNYSLQSKYSTKDSMAFFPGTVLSKLHALLNDIRTIMSTISTLTLLLVVLGILITLVLLGKLFSKRFSLLRAIGAPKRFVFSVMWGYIGFLVFFASLLGAVLGYLATYFISKILSSKMSILIEASLSWQELHIIAIFFTCSILLGLIPAYFAFKQPVLRNIR